MSDIVSVYVVFGSDEEATEVARAMVERRLAACANILGACRSVFRWQGAICEETEIAALFKTSAERADALVEAIAAMHSYDVPAICVWPIAGGDSEYARWVTDQTGTTG